MNEWTCSAQDSCSFFLSSNGTPQGGSPAYRSLFHSSLGPCYHLGCICQGGLCILIIHLPHGTWPSLLHRARTWWMFAVFGTGDNEHLSSILQSHPSELNKGCSRSQWGSGCVHCPWFKQYCTGFPTIWKPGSQNRLTLEPGFRSPDAVLRCGTAPSKDGQSGGREHR